jgi:O-acetyl-ADP-ribose deacetylase (regulator of RNase III)
MSIEWITGNIFTSKAQTIVNTVNCVGVMGAGIALECRLRYPDMHADYVRICKENRLRPGQLWLYKASDRWILNFPTKNHWKAPSREEYLQLGLQKFLDTYQSKGITSIAFPLLGADRGGLSSATSKRIMEKYLSRAQIPVEIYSYDANARDDLYEQFREWLLAGGDVQLAETHKIRKDIVNKLVNAVMQDTTRQLNQLGRVKGVGIRSLEKVFQAARSNMESPQQMGFDLTD